ncbi:hypothetical protein RBB50_006213 [Rhinocladiella similis]
MQCLTPQRPSIKALIDGLRRHRPQHRLFSTSQRSLQLKQVPFLSSWDQGVFEREAYLPSSPARLPRSADHIPPACSKWFIHDNDVDFVLTSTSASTSNSSGRSKVHYPTSSELRTSFWADHESTIVPLEITSKDNGRKGEEVQQEESFRRIEAPLKVLLTYLSNPTSPDKGPSAGTQQSEHEHSIYLAQCDLTSLPPSVADDIPIPLPLISTRSTTGSNHPSSSCGTETGNGTEKGTAKGTGKGVIKGDIYASSLWLGRPPTYTPLHRDPNPNLFIQLAGRKVLRLLPPDVGGAIFDDVQNRIRTPSSRHVQRQTSSATIRGDEMMAGPEKEALHDAVWAESGRDNRYSHVIRTYGLETALELGDALFIPKGWWHSVKGVGQGVTASVNWWFR